jgi:hypothetical protein
MSTSKKHILLLIVVALALLAVAGFWIATQQSTMPPILLPPTSQQSGTSSLSGAVGTSTDVANNDKATSTSGLQHYRNEEWGFEFEYPEEWEVIEKTFFSHYSKFNLVVRPKIGWYKVFPLSVNIVLPEFPERSFANTEKETSEVVVSGVSGVQYKYQFEDSSETAVILPLGKYKIIIGTDDERYQQIFNQFLSSFKFVEPKEK